jgi:hypothetical protein
MLRVQQAISFLALLPGNEGKGLSMAEGLPIFDGK